MKLDESRKRSRESADFMFDFISHVTKTFSKRDCGSEGEKDSVKYMAETVKPYATSVKTESYDVHTLAFMGWIYITVTLILGAFVAAFFMPMLSVIFILVGMAIMILEFVCYRQIVDKFFPKRTSLNMTAVKKPEGEVKQRILISGHADAAYEWTLNYYLGGKAFIAHFLISVIGILYLTAVTIAACVKGALFTPCSDKSITIALGVSGVFVPFWILMYFLFNPKIVSDGATDNLTGCAMGIAFLKSLEENDVKFEHTEIGCICAGGEEAGLRGAKAWVKAHKHDYDDCPTTILCIDTIREEEHMLVNYKDMNGMIKCDKTATETWLEACEEEGVKCKKGSVALGATDAAAYTEGGFKSVCVTAMNFNLPRYYHTRLDVAEDVNKDCLAKTFSVLCRFVEKYDEKVK
mgnify:FL=1